ncbi:hypothetical protein NC651_019810 [Populus alba x Populus x berolinensis]|nr:hypothetical protein NC651_019810 [Populus alba x Populus x berolinensis]
MAGIPGNAGHMTPREGGFHLFGGEQAVIQLPDKWPGRIWPRKATSVEMTLGTSKSALHYYYESLVDGFNVPVSMMPVGGGVACGIAACIAVLGSVQIQKVASLLYLVVFSTQFVPRPIALPLMMLQGLRLARLLVMNGD